MEKLILEKLDKVNDKLNDIAYELGENSAQHSAMGKRLDDIHDQALKTNGRVSVLESFKTKAVAYVTVFTIIVGGLFRLIA